MINYLLICADQALAWHCPRLQIVSTGPRLHSPFFPSWLFAKLYKSKSKYQAMDTHGIDSIWPKSSNTNPQSNQSPKSAIWFWHQFIKRSVWLRLTSAGKSIYHSRIYPSRRKLHEMYIFTPMLLHFTKSMFSIIGLLVHFYLCALSPTPLHMCSAAILLPPLSKCASQMLGLCGYDFFQLCSAAMNTTYNGSHTVAAD